MAILLLKRLLIFAVFCMFFISACESTDVAPTNEEPTTTDEDEDDDDDTPTRRRRRPSSSSSSRGSGSNGTATNSNGTATSSNGTATNSNGTATSSNGTATSGECGSGVGDTRPLSTLTFSKESNTLEGRTYPFGDYYHPDYRPIEDDEIGCSCFGARRHYNLPSSQQSSSSPNQNIILSYYYCDDEDGSGSIYLNADRVNWDTNKNYYLYYQLVEGENREVQRVRLTLRSRNPRGYSVCECPPLPDRNHKQIFVDMERDRCFYEEHGLRVKVWFAREDANTCYFYPSSS